jgi:predicted CoA-binding protein
MQGLDRLFHARSVALVGLSADMGKMTGAPLGILRQTGFGGRIFPVNPRYTEVGGMPCWPSIDALPEAPDAALVMLAAARVPQAVRDCARKGIGAVVVLSSGFEETEEGHAHAAELAQVARETALLLRNVSEAHGLALRGVVPFFLARGFARCNATDAATGLRCARARRPGARTCRRHTLTPIEDAWPDEDEEEDSKAQEAK